MAQMGAPERASGSFAARQVSMRQSCRPMAQPGSCRRSIEQAAGSSSRRGGGEAEAGPQSCTYCCPLISANSARCSSLPR